MFVLREAQTNVVVSCIRALYLTQVALTQTLTLVTVGMKATHRTLPLVHPPASSSDGDREAGGTSTVEHGTQPLARGIAPGSSGSMASSHGGSAMFIDGVADG